MAKIRGAQSQRDPSRSSKHGGQAHEQQPKQPQEAMTDAQDATPQESADVAESAAPVTEQTALDLASHPLPAFSALGKTLSRFKRLRKLNLSNMEPSAAQPDGLDSLKWLGRAVLESKGATKKGSAKSKRERQAADPDIEEEWFGKELTTVNLSGNHALGKAQGEDGESALAGLEVLPTLFSLDLSSCSLKSMPLLVLQPSLRALVLSANDLDTLPTLPVLPNLNTLILSRNRLSVLPSSLPSSLPALKKLSVAHNELKDGAGKLPDFTTCTSLREVRLNGNPGLIALPTHLKSWGKGRDGKAPGLELVDLADCGLADYAAIEPLLQAGKAAAASGAKKGLRNLNLRGNEVAEADDCRVRLLECHSTLRTFNNASILPKRKRVEDTDFGALQAAAQQPLGRTDGDGEHPGAPSAKSEHAGKPKRGSRGGAAKRQQDAAADVDTSEQEPAAAQEVHSDDEGDHVATAQAAGGRRKRRRSRKSGGVTLEAEETSGAAAVETDAVGMPPQKKAKKGHSKDAQALVKGKKEDKKEKNAEKKKSRAQATPSAEAAVATQKEPAPQKGKKPAEPDAQPKAKKMKPAAPVTDLLAGSPADKASGAASLPAPAPAAETAAAAPAEQQPQQRSAVVGVVEVKKAKAKKGKDAKGAAEKKQRPAAVPALGIGTGGGDAWGDRSSAW